MYIAEDKYIKGRPKLELDRAGGKTVLRRALSAENLHLFDTNKPVYEAYLELEKNFVQDHYEERKTVLDKMRNLRANRQVIEYTIRFKRLLREFKAVEDQGIIQSV